MPTARLRVPLHTRMLLGGLVGAGAGIAAHVLLREDPGLATFIRYVAQPVGQVYIRLLFMLVIPLVVPALALGVAGLGDLRHVGRIGLRTLLYTVAVSTIAVVLGLTLTNVLRPGDGMSEATRARLVQGAGERAAAVTGGNAPKSGIDLLVQIVPRNPVAAMAEGDMLAVMFFALMLGIGLAVTRTEAARSFERALEGLYDVTMRLIGMVIALSPLGVAALLFTLTAQLGYEVLAQLARYVGVVLLALVLHQFVVYSVLVRTLGGMSPRRFFGGVQSAMITAFSTSSSNATLPTALKVAEENLKLPTHVSRFVLTIGATANQNGTALFEGVTALFLAQFYGVDLTLGQQFVVMVICILGGVGTAGVPSGSLPVVALICAMVGVPPEGIGLILGVNHFLDMCRTTVNVTGDLGIAAIVSKGEVDAPVELADDSSATAA